MVDIAARVSFLKPTAVNAILSQTRGRKAVSLMRGEPDFRTPGHIVEAAIRALHEGRTGYPVNGGEAELRAAVAEKIARDTGAGYDPAAEIAITDGATAGIYAALTALVNEGDGVMLPDPVYDAYQSPIRLAGGHVIAVPGRLGNGRFHLEAEALEAAWDPSAKVLILNAPWNPVGTVFTRAELEAIAGFAIRRNLILISDEIYERITYAGHDHLSPVSLGPEIRERCVLVNSFSKTYAMTGWRLGYCAGPREIMRAMLMVLAQSSRGPATFVQDAGAAALRGSQECVAEMRRAYAQRRAQVLDRLSGMPRIHALAPEGGFFSMVDIRKTGLTSDEVRIRLLNEAEVVVIHGAAYGPGGEGTVRVSFASGGENLRLGLDRLRAGLSCL